MSIIQLAEEGAPDNFDKIETLLNEGADINERDQDGVTALFSACVSSNVDLARMLLGKNADPNITENFGCAPIHLASQCECVEIVKMLIKAGCNVNVKETNMGMTPLFMAKETNNEEICTLLREAGADELTEVNDEKIVIDDQVSEIDKGENVKPVDEGLTTVEVSSPAPACCIVS
jgi:ankyrin repeat protein